MKGIKAFGIIISTMFILIATVNSQIIEINPIDNNMGYTIIEQGVGNQPTNFKYHVLTINKTYLDLTYDNLLEKYNKNKCYQTDMIRNYLTLAHKEKKMFFYRHKRGLANFVGNGLKFLFGTMDNQDRAEIQLAIEHFRKNTISTNEFNEIIDLINNETKLLSKLETETFKLQNKLTEKVLSDLFLDNVKLYLEHVQDIQLAMQLAQKGIINPKIIDLPTITDLTDLEFENIRATVWLDEEIIFFVLSIPTAFDSVKKIKIIPIPDENKEELVLDDSDYVRKNNMIFTFKNNKIEYAKDNCIRNLLNNNKTECQFQKNIESFIGFVEPNIVVTKNLELTKMEQNCNELNVTIKGNNIINLYNCKIKIRDFELEVLQVMEKSFMLPSVKNIENIVKLNLSLPILKKHIEYVNGKNGNYLIGLLISIFLILLLIFVLFTRSYKCKIFVKYKGKNNEDIVYSEEGRSDIHESPINIP